MAIRWKTVGFKTKATTVNGVTYTATFYPAGNGMRSYWVVQASNRSYENGNDWYCGSWAVVKLQVASEAAGRA